MKGEKIINKFRTHISKMLPGNIKPRFICKGILPGNIKPRFIYKGILPGNIKPRFIYIKVYYPIISNPGLYIKVYYPVISKLRFIYKGKKIGSFFSLKDPIKKEHQTNLVYGYNNKDNPKVVQYIGETNVRFETRTHEHSHSDKHSSLYKHAIKHNYAVQKDDFKILETGYKNTLDRKLAEALYIEELKPQLNEQVRCHNLKLFN